MEKSGETATFLNNFRDPFSTFLQIFQFQLMKITCREEANTYLIRGSKTESPAKLTGLYSLTSRSWAVVADMRVVGFVVMVF